MTRTGVPTTRAGRYDRDVARWSPRASQAVYRRHRLIATLLLVIVAGFLPAVTLAFTVPARADAVSTARPPLTVVVGQGDTLWDLALANAPSRQDPMTYLAEVLALNDVKATALKPGMVLRLPRE